MGSPSTEQANVLGLELTACLEAAGSSGSLKPAVSLGTACQQTNRQPSAGFDSRIGVTANFSARHGAAIASQPCLCAARDSALGQHRQHGEDHELPAWPCTEFGHGPCAATRMM